MLKKKTVTDIRICSWGVTFLQEVADLKLLTAENNCYCGLAVVEQYFFKKLQIHSCASGSSSCGVALGHMRN
jgi:hypothetical protein